MKTDKIDVVQRRVDLMAAEGVKFVTGASAAAACCAAWGVEDSCCWSECLGVLVFGTALPPPATIDVCYCLGPKRSLVGGVCVCVCAAASVQSLLLLFW